MRVVTLLLISSSSLFAAAQSEIETLWTDLAAKRAALRTFHQEFEVVSTSKSTHGSRSSKHSIILDWSEGLWRSRFVAGSGDTITIFDGTDVLHMEEGGGEYVRSKHKSHDGEPPTPTPYALSQPNWAKSTEVHRQPCEIPGVNHECAILDVPLKSWIRGANNQTVRGSEGNERIEIDTVNGLLIQARTVQVIETHNGGYVSDTAYMLKKVSAGLAMNAGLFKMPDGLNEVKELSNWDAPRIKKRLSGAEAPALSVKDIHGNSLTLADFKGKTVLLDFWTTWCPPCRADAPSIDKLYQKYGGKELAVVGFSVNEDREIVEKFLGQHPHEYPIILTSENDMPRPYQIGVFPTYIVIEKDGTVASAVQGEKGFADLKKLLKKAGLESE